MLVPIQLTNSRALNLQLFCISFSIIYPSYPEHRACFTMENYSNFRRSVCSSSISGQIVFEFRGAYVRSHPSSLQLPSCERSRLGSSASRTHVSVWNGIDATHPPYTQRRAFCVGHTSSRGGFQFAIKRRPICNLMEGPRI